MKSKHKKSIPRDPQMIPLPTANPAASLIRDELENRGLAQATAARAMGIPRSRLADIFAGRKGISADTALRLQRYLGLSAEWLLSVQATFDFRKAYHTNRKKIEKEVQPLISTKS